jgi:hypothetical protein
MARSPALFSVNISSPLCVKGFGAKSGRMGGQLELCPMIVISGPERRDEQPVREREKTKYSAHSNRAHEL